MPLQDLTPQLRTRLSRVERWVGVFVLLATLLMLFGLGYYIHQVAKRRGWFLQNAPYHTYVQSATGLKVGDPVRMMGFDVGEITIIEAMEPKDWFNVYVQFQIKEPYYGYLWTDSRVRVGSKDLLGGRYLEVTKGSWGAATVLTGTNNNQIIGLLDFKVKTNINHVPITASELRYVAPTNGAKGYWLNMDESPALTERLEKVVDIVELALPDFLSLTNDLKSAITSVANLVRHTDQLLLSAQPVVTNLHAITENLRRPEGALGEWLLSPELRWQVGQTLTSANATLVTTRQGVDTLSSNLVVSLQHLASLTSNLNAQVQANNLILSDISTLIIDTDAMVQGLKRHWLLKGAFGSSSTNPPPASKLRPRVGDLP